MRDADAVQIVSWEEAATALRVVRTAVFIREQLVLEELEWDQFDAVSVHALAVNNAGQPVGTARLLPDGHIGRMAVLKEWRGQGLGSALLTRLLQVLVKRHQFQAQLHAQTSAIPFYKKFGFEIVGEEFIEADIPHVKMTLSIK
ncbi:GNAT family N-acetyltransferase [Nitrosomonas oligotropha]|uniref:Predicted N-acyltransferase, GNAT family n=1 Tax=Nitrosomonas oligotropha TaxID=42354 RepID=A0A1H8NJT5_9PROT|nr:GNAT family N-acetyltransferase [Nitrosomonas oligotropha]SDW97685.1 Predicted N-acyltransferase, GNAT family [Nitrosomonas oligotropha]SEO29822.1 Predicted N-acyltransferase, GNAT family [Nitrosomonas oligotropha]